jgi:CCR4-NOT transcription complex subunit 7/8
MGIGLAFRKSVFDPSGSSAVLCQTCNNYYNTNNNGIVPKPFKIGINEEGNELINNTLSNMNITATETSAEKNNYNHRKELDNNENSDSKLNSQDENNNLNKNKNGNSKIKNKFNSKITSNKSIETGTSKNNINSSAQKPADSKNLSFFLTEKEAKDITNNIHIDNGPADIQNKNLINNYSNENIQGNYIHITKNKSENESNKHNESDISLLDNINQKKIYKALLSDIKEKTNSPTSKLNQMEVSESNKNVNLISAFNSNLNSQNQKPTANINKTKLGFTKRISVQNHELSDFDITNIKSKWEAMRQSVISTNSNNNFKMLKDENFSELKLAKNETVLYRNCFDSITTDYKKLKSNSKNIEKILSQNFENYKNLKEAEILKFAKALEVYNDLNAQQIKIKDIKIKKLSNLIDQLVEKENYSMMNKFNNCKFKK